MGTGWRPRDLVQPSENRVLLLWFEVVAEAPRRQTPGDVPGLERPDERSYGETVIVRYISGPERLITPEGRKSTR